MLVPYTSIGLLATLVSTIVQARFIDSVYHLQRRAECTNSYTTFTDSIGDWVLEKGSSRENYEITPEGLKIMILPPAQHVRMMDEKVKPGNTW
jgi:hypothetical protein